METISNIPRHIFQKSVSYNVAMKQNSSELQFNNMSKLFRVLFLRTGSERQMQGQTQQCCLYRGHLEVIPTFQYYSNFKYLNVSQNNHTLKEDLTVLESTKFSVKYGILTYEQSISML